SPHGVGCRHAAGHFPGEGPGGGRRRERPQRTAARAARPHRTEAELPRQDGDERRHPAAELLRLLRRRHAGRGTLVYGELRRLPVIRMQRALTAAMVLSVAMLAITARAWAGVDLRSIDVGGYPTVRFAVVTPHASKRPPAVRENGAPVVGLEAHNLGSSKSVVLAVDRSRSMAGRSLLDASAAADSFVRQKPASDRIG